MTRLRSYQELQTIASFEDRYQYLKLSGQTGHPTFGHERWMNQTFYRSAEWKNIRNFIITRDDGFDLGSRDRPILGKIMIHHLNPLTPEMLEHSDTMLLDPDNLISCSMATHNAIHFGDADLISLPLERRPNDTIPWKQ